MSSPHINQIHDVIVYQLLVKTSIERQIGQERLRTERVIQINTTKVEEFGFSF